MDYMITKRTVLSNKINMLHTIFLLKEMRIYSKKSVS